MMRAMDGVRTYRRPVKPVVQPKARVAPPVRPEPSLAYVVGMDGIRRPVYRPVPASEAIPVAAAAVPAVAQVAATAPMDVAAPRSWRPVHLPQFGWRRPAIAFGLVATALVASTTMVRILATPQNTTARAASERPLAASSPTPSPTAVVVAATPAPTPQAAGLQQLLDTFVAANPDKFGIVVKNLTTGETATINGERQITSASLYKLFVAQRIYQQIDLGRLDYNKSAGGGTGRTVNQCLTVMINISDNGCGRALGSILGWGSQDHALSAEGYKQTTLATPQKTSSSDVARLFERLYNNTLVSPASTDRFMALLKDQRVNNRLPLGLPAGTIMAHKTGDLDGVVHDAGIVYGPKGNYLVVVTSGPWATPGSAPAQFANLSKQLWNYFEN